MTQPKNSKLTIAILFGGRSAEHDVSIMSARNIVSALDTEKYEPVLVYIRSDGRWFRCSSQYLFHGDAETLQKKLSEEIVPLLGSGGTFVFSADGRKCCEVDSVFPVLHGPFGEDGTVQGLLELVGVPYVGVGVLGSAVGMDKDVMKRLLKEAGLPVGDFLVFRKEETPALSFENIKKTLGLPVFVKPANLGSSVGVSKVETEKEFQQAIQNAFQYDVKILIEASLQGREIECAVLGNRDPHASGVGEIIPAHGFYSYEAKYIDADGAKLIIPADLPQEGIEEIQHLAVKTFQTLECHGLGRVDFFVTDKGIFVNEINTMPGFTSVSMYPKLWEASGIGYSELLDRLIQLARERFATQQELKVR